MSQRSGGGDVVGVAGEWRGDSMSKGMTSSKTQGASHSHLHLLVGLVKQADCFLYACFQESKGLGPVPKPTLDLSDLNYLWMDTPIKDTPLSNELRDK